ncbi:MAG: GPW/gp25 family protein [Potamolinea sp.]
MADITNNEYSRSFLGTGWAFPLGVSLQGNLQVSFAERNIEESIGIILGTKLGERVYRPDFGSRLSELVFAPMNTQTLLLIRIYIQEALEMWEPRIVIDGIYTEPDPLKGLVDITIRYHPKNTHDTRSMVYPFFLLPPG